MGLFVYTQKGSIISMVDLPTTEIIEPLFFCRYGNIILVAPNVKNYNGLDHQNFSST
jgi:hypothetical protein